MLQAGRGHGSRAEVEWGKGRLGGREEGPMEQPSFFARWVQLVPITGEQPA